MFSQTIATHIAAGRLPSTGQQHPGLDWLYMDGSYSAHMAMARLHDHVREGGDLGGNFLCNATNSKLTSNPISWSWIVPAY